MKNADETYVDFLLDEWSMRKCSRRVQTCLRRVLKELSPEALLSLNRERKLEVMVLPEAGYSVWAYFPVHRRRGIAQELGPKPATRLLLVLSEKHFQEQPVKLSENHLRDHLGHMLLYLRSPKAPNECSDAQREWRSNLAGR